MTVAASSTQANSSSRARCGFRLAKAMRAPVCYLTAALGGVGDAAKRLRAFVSGSLLQWPRDADGTRRMRPRPVMLNTWEGNYFDHKMTSLKAQADAGRRHRH